jgi:hypothetical protein
MINNLIKLFSNRATTDTEARIETALRNEGRRIRMLEKEDEGNVANVVKQASRRPKIRAGSISSPWASQAPRLLAAAAIVALFLFIMRPEKSIVLEPVPVTKATQPSPVDETLFGNPVKSVIEPFAAFAFNPLDPVTEEWSRFTGDARENVEALLSTAKSLAALPVPHFHIAPKNLLPSLPELQRFSPYGNEIQRVRSDALNALEALPFIPKLWG